MQPEVLPIQSFDLMDSLGNMAADIAMDTRGALLAAMDFEKALLDIAHTIAAQAIRLAEPDQKAERVNSAERQAKLIGRLYTQLQAVTPVEQR